MRHPEERSDEGPLNAEEEFSAVKGPSPLTLLRMTITE